MGTWLSDLGGDGSSDGPSRRRAAGLLWGVEGALAWCVASGGIECGGRGDAQWWGVCGTCSGMSLQN